MHKLANLGGTLLIVGLAGCMSTSPAWDARFGEAARMAAAQQLINPDASRNADPVAGMDGKAAQAAIGEYGKSFAQPPSQPDVLMIGVGSGGR